MGYTALVASELTPALIEAGEKLIRDLDNTGTKVTAALWLLASEDDGWRLLIASPEVAVVGAREFYGKINERLVSLSDTELSVSHITAVRPDEPTVSALRTVIKTGQGISRIRFTRNVINGVLIPDSLIYRLVS